MREKKRWVPGLAMDFDTSSTAAPRQVRLRASTTNAPYQSAPPPNFKPVARTQSFVLWKRLGADAPPFDHRQGRHAGSRALVRRRGSRHRRPRRRRHDPARTGGGRTVALEPLLPVRRAGHRQPGAPTGTGRWNLSLQYASQVPLTVHARGESTTLPPSLDGMYIDHKGQGSFWSAGSVDARRGMTTVTVRAEQPTGLQRLLGVKRQVWLGYVAATRPGVGHVPLRAACGHDVDHWRQHS